MDTVPAIVYADGCGALDVAGCCEIGRQASEDDCGHLVDPVREQPFQRVSLGGPVVHETEPDFQTTGPA